MVENFFKKLNAACNNDNEISDSMLAHKASPEYLQELLKDKRQLQTFPNIFVHLDFILEREITRVRQKLFHINESVTKTETELPEPSGNIVTLQEKVFVPVSENPNYNFVGRLLGPRGLTAKQLEQDLECKIMVRGKGSLRDKRKEDSNRGKPNWEHLDEELHVLVSVEDFENRAAIKLRHASDTIRSFLEQGVRTPENEDRLKQLQLMELAVLNDKDRQQAQVQQQVQQQQQRQLILQHHSLTVLNNQAAAMAAAAAQLLPGGQYQASNLLSRLQPQTLANPLQSNCIYPGTANTILNSVAPLHSMTNSPTNSVNNGLPTNTQTVTSNNLTNYLQNSSLTGILCPLTANVALSAPTAAGQIGIGLPVNQLAGTPIPLSINPNLQTAAVSPSVINCTSVGQDQLAVIASALLNGNHGTGSTVLPSVNSTGPGVTNTVSGINTSLSLTNGSVAQPYLINTLTPNLVDAVNIMEYNSSTNTSSTANNANNNVNQHLHTGSLKLRSIQGSASTVTRMHPYMRQ